MKTLKAAMACLVMLMTLHTQTSTAGIHADNSESPTVRTVATDTDTDKTDNTASANPTNQLFTTDGDMIIANVGNTQLSRTGSLDKLLKMIPFVVEVDGNYQVQGKQHTHIYIDNRRVLNADELKCLSPLNISTITIMAHTEANHYAEAEAVIEIRTIRGATGLGGSVYAVGGSNGKPTFTGKATLEYNTDKLQLFAGVGHSEIKHERSSTVTIDQSGDRNDISTDERTDYAHYNLNAEAGFNYKANDNNTLSLHTRVVKEREINDMDLRHRILTADDTMSKADKNDNYVKEYPLKWTTNAQFDTRIGNTTLAITNDLNMMSIDKTTRSIISADSRLTSELEMSYVMNTFKFVATSPITDNATLRYGAEYTYTHDECETEIETYNYTPWIDDEESERTQNILAEFVNFNYRSGIWDISAGVRFEQYKERYTIDDMEMSNVKNDKINHYSNLTLTVMPTEETFVSLSYRDGVTNQMHNYPYIRREYISEYFYKNTAYSAEPFTTSTLELLAKYKDFLLTSTYKHSEKEMWDHNINSETDSTYMSYITPLILPINRFATSINWQRKMGIYTPNVELTVGHQLIKQNQNIDRERVKKPYFNCKIEQTLSFNKAFDVLLSAHYKSRHFEVEKEISRQFTMTLAVSKQFDNGLYIQLSADNLNLPQKSTTQSIYNRKKYTQNKSYDNANIAVLLSYNLGSKSKRRIAEQQQ